MGFSLNPAMEPAKHTKDAKDAAKKPAEAAKDAGAKAADAVKDAAKPVPAPK